MLRRIAIPFLLGLAQAGATLGVTYFSPSYGTLPLGVHLSVTMGFALALVAPLTAAYSAVLARREKLRSDAYSALLAALTKISDQADVPAKHIGLSAYVVRRPTFWPWQPIQVRVARVRVARFPPPSTIVWTRRKGFLGECWDNQNKVVDRHIRGARFAKYFGCDRATWEWAPKEITVGLTYEEWQMTQERYAYIRVAPMMRKTKSGEYRYFGCVSLDTTHDEHTEQLGTDEVRELLLDATESLQTSLQNEW